MSVSSQSFSFLPEDLEKKKLSFQRARTDEQIQIRKAEILCACFELYKKGGFEAVNFKAISEMTSFTRQSIYNYYKTREEALLDMLLYEHRIWFEHIKTVTENTESMTKEEYARFISKSFMEHGLMLELTSLLINVLKNSSRPEKMTEFGKAGADSYNLLLSSVSKFIPELSFEAHCTFTSSVISLALGVYPVEQLYKNQILPASAHSLKIPDFIKLTPDLFDELFYLCVLCLISGLK